MGRSPQNTEFERMKRRGEVAKLYLQGIGQHVIAERLGVSTQAVFDDLNWLRDQWKNTHLEDYNAARAETLAKLDHLEYTYWDAWERSQQPIETVTVKVEEMIKTINPEDDKEFKSKGKKMVGKPVPVTKMVPYKTIKDTKLVGQVGNQSFLQGVERCIEMRAKIIGLLKDTNVTNNITMNWESLTQAIVLQEGQALPQQTPLQIEHDPIEAKIARVESEAVPTKIEETPNEQDTTSIPSANDGETLNPEGS